MTLIGVEHLGGRCRGQLGKDLDGANAPDAEQQFLEKAVFPAAAVQPVGDRTQRVVIFRNVGIQQQERHTPDIEPPDPRVECQPVWKCECDLSSAAVRMPQYRQWQSVRIEHGIGLLLPALARDRLPEVTSAVE